MPGTGGRRIRRRDDTPRAASGGGFRGRARDRIRSRWVVWCAVLVSVVATGAAAATLALTYEPVTQYDEQAHFDYVARIASEHRLISVGETYGADTVREMGCRGVGRDPDAPRRSGCGPALTSAELPFQGVNYVAGYSPVYYAATAAVAGPLSTIDGLSLFEAARLADALWFALGAGVLTAALVRLQVRPWLAAAASVLLASTPAFLLQGGAVTPDSLSLLAGGSALLVLGLRTRWRRRLLWATVLGVVVALAKSSFVPLATFVVLLAVVFPMAGSASGPASRARWAELGRRRWAAGLVLAALPFVASGLNSVWRSASLAPGATADGGMSEILRTPFTLQEEILRGGVQLLQPLESVAYIAPTGWVAIAVLTQTVLLGGTVVLALQPHLPLRSTVRTMAFGAIGSWILAMIFLPVTFYVLFHAQGTQGRYALPVMPLFLAAVVLAVKDARGVTWLVGGVASLGWAVALSAVLTA